MDPIAELEKRIQESKRLVTEQENALAVLKKAFGGAIYAPTPALGKSKVQQSGTFSFDDLSVPDTKQRSKVTEDVKSVVSNFGTNEFTVLHVEAALLQRGIVIDSKSPRARISLAMAKLLDEGFVTRVFEGSGNVPHRYLLKGETPTTEHGEGFI
jgi:hypothetical protein